LLDEIGRPRRESDLPARLLNVRYRGQPGHPANGTKGPKLTRLGHRQWRQRIV